MDTLLKIWPICGHIVHIALPNGTLIAMAMTLNTLLAQRSLDLSLVVEGDAGALDAPISWMHFSESPDPTPYLEGGEILLTTGLLMPAGKPDEPHRLFASRLADAGVRGVGFGIGVQHASIPQWLVYQCEAAGVPMFCVPLGTPFIAISKAVARGISSDTSQNFARMYRNQQRLLRSVHTLDPVSTIVSRLAELIGGWAALLNPVGTVIASSHHALPVDMDSLGDALAFSVLGEAKFTVSKGYDIAIFHIASPTRQTLGYLVSGRKGEKGSIDHPLAAEAASLLSLAINATADSNRSLANLRSTMTRMCLEGNADTVRQFADDVWNGMPVQPLAALRIVGQQDALEDAGRLFEPFRRTLAKNTNLAVFGMVDGDMWAIVSQTNARTWTEQLTHDSRLTVGQSSGATWHDMPRARHEAHQAAAEALTAGAPLIRYGSDRSTATLESMVEPSLMRAFADLKLAPIADLTFDLSTGPHTMRPDADTQIRAVDALWAWLRSRGKTEEAARMTGMHRHTLTKYLGIIANALHTDLSDPGTCAELWYACRFSRFGHTLAQPETSSPARR